MLEWPINISCVPHTFHVLLMFWLRGQSVIKQKSKRISVHIVTEMSMINKKTIIENRSNVNKTKISIYFCRGLWLVVLFASVLFHYFTAFGYSYCMCTKVIFYLCKTNAYHHIKALIVISSKSWFVSLCSQCECKWLWHCEMPISNCANATQKVTL